VNGNSQSAAIRGNAYEASWDLSSKVIHRRTATLGRFCGWQDRIVPEASLSFFPWVVQQVDIAAIAKV
jgi:hypothetical protein